MVRGGYGRFFDKTHFELISAILTAGVVLGLVHRPVPGQQRRPGSLEGSLPTDPMLVGGPTVNRTLLTRCFRPAA